LRAFEAAGRLGGIKLAAGELGVTPTAVSQQVKLLEDWLGVALFRRRTNGVALTAAGDAFWPKLEALFDQLAHAAGQIRPDRPRETLSIVTFPSLAVRWFMPRMGRLQAVLGPIELRLITIGPSIRINPDEFDLGLHYRIPGDGLRAEAIAPRRVIVVMSPALRASGPPIRGPADLLHYPMVNEPPIDRHGVTDIDWPGWLARFGVRELTAPRGPTFGFHHLCLQAALDGAGIALSNVALAGDLLASGALVQPLPHGVALDDIHYLTIPERVADDPLVRTVADWIKREMAAHLAAVEGPTPPPPG
jgi:LysR family glycine cleavage system transcriptional activator